MSADVGCKILVPDFLKILILCAIAPNQMIINSIVSGAKYNTVVLKHSNESFKKYTINYPQISYE